MKMTKESKESKSSKKAKGKGANGLREGKSEALGKAKDGKQADGDKKDPTGKETKVGNNSSRHNYWGALVAVWPLLFLVLFCR